MSNPVRTRRYNCSQGRIHIPERLVSGANLSREVVICGVRDHLEIRRRDDFDKGIDEAWDRYPEYQLKARKAYQDVRRQTGQEAG